MTEYVGGARQWTSHAAWRPSGRMIISDSSL